MNNRDCGASPVIIMKHNSEYYNCLDEKLRRFFGAPKKYCECPTSALVRGVLSQNTTDRNRDKAFERLRNRFPDWHSVLDADDSEIVEAIRIAGMANQRAVRIKDLLRWLAKNNKGKIDARFILKFPPQEAMDKLTSINGIGMKTASVFLLFCGNMPFFPVDTHIKRIMIRLNIFPPNTSADKMIIALSKAIPAKLHYSLHLNLIELGRTICTARKILCEKCPIKRFCKTGEGL